MSPTKLGNVRSFSRFGVHLKLKLTSPRVGGGPRGRRRSLWACLDLHGKSDGNSHAPEVLVMRNRALVRLARPNMFKVPMNEVLIVFTALN